MIQTPMDTLRQFPIRKSGKQKQAFRDAAVSYLESQGYCCKLEKGSVGSVNILAGDPEKAKFLVTAHYDTPAGMFIPNLITPCNLLTFLLYQMLVVVLMLGIMGIAAAVVWLITKNPDLTFGLSYLCLWIFLGLMMFGPANRNNANDNTSGVVTVLEMARTLPENQREKVCFVLFDLEEAGLIGSSAYRKAHKAATEHQIVLNLDCVGDGSDIALFPTKKLCKDREKMLLLCKAVGRFGSKTISVIHKGFRYYPSDQKNFPLGVGIAAFNRKKHVGLYCDKIHTAKDTVLDESNVNLLRAALTSLITGDTIS